MAVQIMVEILREIGREIIGHPDRSGRGSKI